MSDYQNCLSELLHDTKEIHKQAQAINSKMEDNEAEQLEEFQMLFDKREHVIQQLGGYTQQQDFHWTEEDKQIIQQLKEHEQQLQPIMNGLHQSFLSQMNRINQTKQISKKYIGAYQHTATEGSFIDKRK